MIAIAVLLTLFASRSSSTITRTVTAQPPDIGSEGAPPERREVRIRCTGSSSTYVSETGDPIGFNGSTWTYPDPEPLCEGSTPGYDRTPVIIAMLLFGGALGILFVGPMQQRLFDRAGPVTSFHDPFRTP
jgi:hypothetical protein